MSCSLFERLTHSLICDVLMFSSVPAILRKPSLADKNIVGQFRKPPINEDQIPGSTIGVSNVLFWVDFSSIVPHPENGDTIIINRVEYEIKIPDVDHFMATGIMYLKRLSRIGA